MIPDTRSRVSEMTAESVNTAIRRRTEESVSHYASAGPEAIEPQAARTRPGMGHRAALCKQTPPASH